MWTQISFHYFLTESRSWNSNHLFLVSLSTFLSCAVTKLQLAQIKKRLSHLQPPREGGSDQCKKVFTSKSILDMRIENVKFKFSFLKNLTPKKKFQKCLTMRAWISDYKEHVSKRSAFWVKAIRHFRYRKKIKVHRFTNNFTEGNVKDFSWNIIPWNALLFEKTL